MLKRMNDIIELFFKYPHDIKYYGTESNFFIENMNNNSIEKIYFFPTEKDRINKIIYQKKENTNQGITTYNFEIFFLLNLIKSYKINSFMSSSLNDEYSSKIKTSKKQNFDLSGRVKNDIDNVFGVKSLEFIANTHVKSDLHYRNNLQLNMNYLNYMINLFQKNKMYFDIDILKKLQDLKFYLSAINNKESDYNNLLTLSYIKKYLEELNFLYIKYLKQTSEEETLKYKKILTK